MPTLKQLKQMAGRLEVANQAKLKKPDLIRAIQKAEGHDPCYERITGCGQDDCLFMGDCQPASMNNAKGGMRL